MQQNSKSAKKDAESLRGFLKQRRLRLGLGQQDLAQLAGVANGLIGMIETGKRGVPRKETIIKLARALKVGQETAGEVVNFMNLVVSGVVPLGVIDEVANGNVRAARAMQRLTQVAPDEYDQFTPVPDRHDRLSKVIELLRTDLSPTDLAAVSHLLRRLYEMT